MVELSESVTETRQAPASPAAESLRTPAANEPTAKHSKWYLWRKEGKQLIDYLLDSEVHTYAFSVAANAILSFIPFCVLLYTLAIAVFHSHSMVRVVNMLVNYFLPTATPKANWVANNILATAIMSSKGGIQAISLLMILVACTGIFLPLEVALNQAWGVNKSRNYLLNQAVALGLATLMVVLGVASIFLNLGAQKILTVLFFHHIDNIFFRGLSYIWMATSTGVASILFFFAIYWVLPNRRVPWRSVMRTSVVTGIVWLVAKLIFMAALPHMRLEDLYGPFFVSVGLIFWGYASGLILFAGAQFSVRSVSASKTASSS